MFMTPGSRAGIKTPPRLAHGYFAVSVGLGTKAAGTVAPDPRRGSIQHYTNAGAHTLAPPSLHCAMQVDILNASGAGAITTSAWTKVDGDALDTTTTSRFRAYVSVGPAGAHLTVKKLA
jgi:hypothetical protein